MPKDCYNGIAGYTWEALWKAGDYMPTNEKEYNGYLLDQLSAVERIERQVKKGDLKAVEEEIEILKNEINRKLYQQPPLTGN